MNSTPKWKISYISGKEIYKKIFFSGHFDEIFISKVDFCKFWLVWGLRKKVVIFDLRTSKRKISYISGKGIYKKIFFSGHFDEIFISKVDFGKFWLVWGLRKKVGIFDLRTSKRKISYISGKGIYKKIFFRAILMKFLLVKLILAKLLYLVKILQVHNYIIAQIIYWSI